MSLHASLGLWKFILQYISVRVALPGSCISADVHQTVLTVKSLAPGVSSDI